MLAATMMCLSILSTKFVLNSIFRLEVQSAATLIEYLAGHHQELLPVFGVMMAKVQLPFGVDSSADKRECLRMSRSSL